MHRSCRDAQEDDLVLGAQAQPCTRGGSLYQGNDGSFGFARRGVEIAQGVERLDQPVALIRFPTAGIDPQPRHRRAVEAPAQAPLKARHLESGRNLRNLRGGKIARRPVTLILADFAAAEHGLSERAGDRLRRAA